MSQDSLLKRLRHRIRVPLIRFVYFTFAKLSLAFSHKVGHFVGWLFWLSNGHLRSITQQNIAACFPDIDDDKRNALVKKSLIETGKTMLEVPYLWNGPTEKFDGLIKAVHGREHLEAAFARNKGTLTLAPHLGAWEVVGLYLSKHYPMVTMYRPPHVPDLDDLIQSGRTRYGAKLITTDVRGVRQLYQALKEGKGLGILPDQDPGRNGGEFAPFFNINTNTMTLVNRILHKSDAAAVFIYAKRLANSEGYEIHIDPAPEELSEGDVKKALRVMNACIEKQVKECTEQYQWNYKRFKTRPEGETKFYH